MATDNAVSSVLDITRVLQAMVLAVPPAEETAALAVGLFGVVTALTNADFKGLAQVDKSFTMQAFGGALQFKADTENQAQVNIVLMLMRAHPEMFSKPMNRTDVLNVANGDYAHTFNAGYSGTAAMILYAWTKHYDDWTGLLPETNCQ